MEQVLRLQLDKLAMIVSYSSSRNSAAVPFTSKSDTDPHPQQLIRDLWSNVCACFTTVAVIPCKGGAHLQRLGVKHKVGRPLSARVAKNAPSLEAPISPPSSSSHILALAHLTLSQWHGTDGCCHCQRRNSMPANVGRC